MSAPANSRANERVEGDPSSTAMITSPPEFHTWMVDRVVQTEATLERLLPSSETSPAQLHEAMRYAVLSRGKRMRPLLCYAAGELAGAQADVIAPVSAAIEMVHVFSLVQDDLPAMDNDELRHGKPALHIQYDEATALLVCDALLPLAMKTLAEVPLPSKRRIALIHALASAIGSLGLTGGQFLDLANVGARLDVPALKHMHRLKTGALIRASLRMGALCGAPDVPRHAELFLGLDGYADSIGLAFQIADDVLDVTGEVATLGKSVGKDAASEKPTWASLLGVEAARAYAWQLHRRTQDLLDPWGSRAYHLRCLADCIVNRST